MKSNMLKRGLFAVLAAGMMVLPQAFAQNQGGRGGRGGRGPGNFDPAQFRQRIMERIQENLGATDEEWKVIEPLLTDVMEKQRAVTGSRMGGLGMFFRPPGGGPGGDRGGRGSRFGRPQDPAVAALQEAIEKKAPASELKAKIAAVREAREKARKELEAAQEKLRAVLTLEQEAKLTLAGLL
ncbi:MAG: hypothetical protein D6766_01925 [Verrucomicrobia bacterium]|nr:MAG: hypothetical protein D6766_01925 [Verrucomicrobiota bacterium]